jgi:hypothetical protein
VNVVAALFAWIFDPHPQEALRREEAYLAQSVDMCDLERRMRELDHRHRVADAAMRTV